MLPGVLRVLYVRADKNQNDDGEQARQ